MPIRKTGQEPFHQAGTSLPCSVLAFWQWAAMIQRTEDIAPWLARGCRLFTYAADVILLMEAARGAVEVFRAELARRSGSNAAAQ